MNQPGLQTEQDLIESPQERPKSKGLVPRNSVLVVLVIIVLVLFGFAYRDIASSQSHTNVEGTDGQPQSKAAAAESVGPAPLESDIGLLADGQAAKVAATQPVLTATPPSAPPTVATRISGTGEAAPVVLGEIKGQPAAQVERASAAAESGIFAIDGGRGTEAIAQTVGALATDPIQRQIEALKQVGVSAPKTQDPTADIVRAVTAAQAGQKPAVVQGKDQAWLTGEAATTTADAVYAKTPASPFMIFQGTRIPIVTREEVNSDLPGPVTAMSTGNVYDSINQCAVLIPAGTKFIGSYSADIRPGQSRALLAYRRMIFPDGRSVDLEGAQGVDGRGAAGAEGDVNNHFLQMFGYGFALALIGDQLGGKTNVTIRSTDGTSQTTTIAGQVISDTANKIMTRNSNIPPTIKLEPGTRLFVTIVRDIALTPTNRKNCK